MAGARGVAVAHGVADEVLQQLAQQDRVGPHVGGRAAGTGAALGVGDARGRGRGAEVLHDVGQDVADRDGLQDQAGGVGARVLQDGLDEPLHALRGAQGGAGPLRALGAQGGGVDVQQELEVADDGGQGGGQVVAGDGGEVGQLVVGAPQLLPGPFEGLDVGPVGGDVLHGHDGADDGAGRVVQRAAGADHPHGVAVAGGDEHLHAAHGLPGQGAAQGDLAVGQRGAVDGQEPVRGAGGAVGAVDEAVQAAGGGVEDGEPARGVARHDGDVDGVQ